MKKIGTIAFAVFVSVSIAFGQQKSFLSLFSVNPYSSNKAYGGFDKSLSVNFHVRNQWNGLEGGVQTQSLNAHIPLYVLNGGVGIYGQRDVSGPLQLSEAGISYNYVFDNSLGTWSVGASIGLGQATLNGKELRTPDGIYSGGVDHQDDDLPQQNAQGLFPKLGTGLYFRRRAMELGISIDNLTAASSKLDNEKYLFKTQRLMTAFGVYNFVLSGNIGISGHLQLMSDFKQTQAQIGAVASYNNNIYGGAAFRGYNASNNDALIFLTGIRINQHFVLFYAYDLLISGLNSVSSNNTHEFALHYNLNELIRTGLPPKVIYNPRF